MRLSFFLMFLVSLVPALALGEYRAYELTITNSTSGKTRTVTSTLDQYQYPEYKHLSTGEAAVYVSSWMCYGRTNNQAICNKPDSGATPARGPAQNPVAPNTTDPALQTPAN